MSKGKFKIGIDVGGTKTAYGLYDEKLQLIAYEKHRTDNNASQEEFTDSIRDVILRMLSVFLRTAQIWLCSGRIRRCRCAAITGMWTHSWASEKEAKSASAIIDGSSLCPPDAQFSI